MYVGTPSLLGVTKTKVRVGGSTPFGGAKDNTSCCQKTTLRVVDVKLTTEGKMTTENQTLCDRCVLQRDCCYTHLCDDECYTGNFYDIDDTDE